MYVVMCVDMCMLYIIICMQEQSSELQTLHQCYNSSSMERMYQSCLLNQSHTGCSGLTQPTSTSNMGLKYPPSIYTLAYEEAVCTVETVIKEDLFNCSKLPECKVCNIHVITNPPRYIYPCSLYIYTYIDHMYRAG